MVPGNATESLTSEVPTAAEAEAEYQLEASVVCPSCKSSITTLKVVRMLRTRVNFTSTLPRRGRTVACPECSVVLSAELGALS